MSAGRQHSLALTASGAVWSWGWGMDGRPGHGDEVWQALPKHIVALTERVAAVSADAWHSLAVMASGAVWSWGGGLHGKLGHSDDERQLLPRRIVTLKNKVFAVSAGARHSLAVTASGEVCSWGSGGNGRLGHGDEEGQLRPKHTVALKERMVAVSAGDRHSLAVTASGTVWSWRDGQFGRLGHGDQESELLPKRIIALSLNAGT